MTCAEQTDAGKSEIPAGFSSDIGQGALCEFDLSQQPGIQWTQLGEELIEQTRGGIHS